MKHLFPLLIALCSASSLFASIDTIEVSNFQYTPQFLEINLGDTVRFIWIEGNHPTVSGADGQSDDVFEAISMNSSNTQTDLVLENPGIHEYFCALHYNSDNMYGQITVTSTTVLEDCSDLFFSEYIEGSGTNKALEIYNPTETSIDLSDYSIYRFNNGNTTTSFEGTLSGILESGGVFIITHTQADSSLLEIANLQNDDMVLFNGNDAMALYKDGQLLDVIGEIGDDPGKEWMIGNFGTENGTLVRNPDILKGQTDWSEGVNEWSSYNENEFQFLGSHNNNTCATIATFDCQDLFFSEYVEGTGNHTALEIFNPTNEAIDLINYSIERYNNASTTPSYTENLTGVLEPLTTLVFVNPGAGNELLGLADVVSETTIFSGNDAIVLKKDGNAIDQIGEVGINPGVFWEVGLGATVDYTLVRSFEINEGTTDWTEGQMQWNTYPMDTYDLLGSHSNICGSSNPLIGFLNETAFIEEDEGEYLIGFQLAGFTSETEIIEIELLSGTATEGADFVFMDTSFPVNESTETPLYISIPIINDNEEETTETITLSLSSFSGNIDIGTSELTINIQDDDAPLPLLNIVDVRDIDSDGATLDEGTLCELRGIVYGINLQDGGHQFTLIDPTAGISVYNSGNPNVVYEVNEGDSIHVEGEITQFRGLMQIRPSQITLISSDNPVKEPIIVETLGEETESDIIQVECVTLVDPNEWTPGVGFGFNVRAHNESGEFFIRIDDQVDLFNQATPPLFFTVSGIGGQFSTTSQGPFLDGYQIVPQNFMDIQACSTVMSGIEEIKTTQTIKAFPNPTTDWLHLESNKTFGEILISDMNGQVILTERILPDTQLRLNVNQLIPGMYIVNLKGESIDSYTQILVQ